MIDISQLVWRVGVIILKEKKECDCTSVGYRTTTGIVTLSKIKTRVCSVGYFLHSGIFENRTLRSLLMADNYSNLETCFTGASTLFYALKERYQFGGF